MHARLAAGVCTTAVAISVCLLQGCGSSPHSAQPATVAGAISGIVQTGNTYQITGWACDPGSAASITVDVYAGGSSSNSGGTLLGNFPANLASDSSVAKSCDSTGNSYGFAIPITTAMQAKFGALPIYVDGISSSGSAALAQSGKFTVPQLVWFAPLDSFTQNSSGVVVPYMEVDYLDLFAASSPWPEARSHIQVFKIYSQLAFAGSDEDLQTIFQYLKANNILLAMEAGPLLYSAQCGQGIEGYMPNVQVITDIAQRIKNLGGDLAYIGMDEPLYFGHYYQGVNACNASIDTIAQQAAITMQAYKAVFPNLQVGDIEPLDNVASVDGKGQWPEVTQAWIQQFQADAGFPLAFVHDDVSWGGVPPSEITPDFQTLFMQDGIPFGVIFDGTNDAVSDEAWMTAAEANIQSYNASGNAQPAQVILQTWDPYPTHALPETSPTALTYLVDFYFSPQAQQQSSQARNSVSPSPPAIRHLERRP